MVTGLVDGSSSVVTISERTPRSVALENIGCAVVAALAKMFTLPVEVI